MCSKKVYIFIFILFFLFYSYDWFQTDSLITIVIYTKQKVGIFNEGIITRSSCDIA